MKRFLSEVFAACLFALLAAPAPAIQLPIHHKAKPTAKAKGSDASVQPDKELYDKAMEAMKKNRFDVARLDLQTLLTTYPESEYQMKAKLAVGDSWYHEGGTAALTQAEAEYKDFITFFPNVPEAAEAQMRVADIYYQQMEKPDRDPANAERAEQEYRTMLQQYPDSPLVPRAQQKLREVQEVLAERQYEIGSFYASRESWNAAIARLQTLTDQYPLFSHSDLALIQLGDAYRAEARWVQALPNMPAKPKQELMKAYDDRAAAAYGRVVTHYAMSPHVEDARERLLAINRPIPEPTQQELAASETLEQSRTGVSLKSRALFLVKHGPSTVEAARVGDPTLTDPPQVNAPQVNEENKDMINAALRGQPVPAPGEQQAPGVEAASNNTAAPANTSSASSQNGETLQLESVPTASSADSPAIGASIVNEGDPGNNASASQNGGNTPSSGASSSGSAPATSTDASQTGQPATQSGAQTGSQQAAQPGSQPGFRPAGTAAGDPGSAAAAAAAGVPGAQNPGGLERVAPTNTVLPPVEQPAAAPPQINDAHPSQVQTGTDTGTGKKKPPKYDSSSESSSKHKKKKGLDKLNPF
jgi:outer membrane protein assembly factor BamD